MTTARFTKAEIRAEAARLQQPLLAAGAVPVEPDILQPAEVLLELYGEDIRARAYVAGDPLRGDRMLRPDFTVPVVQAHLASGGALGRYTYAGEVFRRQDDDPGRASEYIQVGYEILGARDPEDAEAEVFEAIFRALEPLQMRVAIGDLGLLIAAVRGLSASERRKAAMLRHIWRPTRFRRLLERFAAPLTVRSSEFGAAPHIGLRSADEIHARLQVLANEATQPPLPASEAERLEALLSVHAPAPQALAALRSIAGGEAALSAAVERLSARLEAMQARGIDVDSLIFEASYGRASMEYYDGFVFGFYAEGHDAAPPLATGGRYDALTRALGADPVLPAVGGVIRPGVVLEARQ
ncbi:MAG: ATP phosphoribosyltransferase regulatory subunit [Pseudomonadota bacterium]